MTPACRHLHTDGRPCGSPALRGEPFCFHHHTARKPMPRRTDLFTNRILLTPQLPAPDDFPAIQRAIGEVLRLLVNNELTDPRAATLLKGLAIASQNLARGHRRDQQLAAAGLLAAQVTDFVNDPKHGTIALDPNAPNGSTAAPNALELPNGPEALEAPEALATPGASTAQATEAAAPVPDPIPFLTPDPSPQTSYDQAKTIEINNYFQAIYDKRQARSEASLAQREADLETELQARYEDRYTRYEAELEARFEARLQTELVAGLETRPIPIQQNQDLTSEYENILALAS